MVASLPPTAPVAVRLIERSVDSNNNSIYVERNSRIIKGWGVPANTRYIIDIIGYWRKHKGMWTWQFELNDILTTLTIVGVVAGAGYRLLIIPLLQQLDSQRMQDNSYFQENGVYY